jgi:hypothetical protein
MRTFPLLILLSVISYQLSAQSIQQLDAKYGFKGIKLDELISNLKIPMNFVSTHDDVYSRYLVVDDSYYNVGEAKLYGVIIETISDKVYRIYLKVKGTENLKSLVESFVQFYGPPTENEEKETTITYIWQTSLTTLAFHIDLNDGIDTEGLVLLYSKKMFELDKELKSQKAGSDL